MDIKGLLKSKKFIAAIIAVIVAVLSFAFPQFGDVFVSIGSTVSDVLSSDASQAVSQTIVE
jgi:hypothetical protein